MIRARYPVGKYLVCEEQDGNAPTRYAVWLTGRRLGAQMSAPTVEDCKRIECPPLPVESRMPTISGKEEYGRNIRRSNGGVKTIVRRQTAKALAEPRLGIRPGSGGGGRPRKPTVEETVFPEDADELE